MITCTFENSDTAVGLRHVTVDAAVHDDNGNILLVRRSAHLTEGGKWALVGGYMERDESAPDAVRREILEETGWRCAEPRFLAVITDPDRTGDDRRSITVFFAAKALAKVAVPDHESRARQWFPLDGGLPDELAFDHASAAGAPRRRLARRQCPAVAGPRARAGELRRPCRARAGEGPAQAKGQRLTWMSLVAGPVAGLGAQVAAGPETLSTVASAALAAGTALAGATVDYAKSRPVSATRRVVTHLRRRCG